MFSWFDTRAAKDFGSTMARFYIERMPLNAKLSDKQFASKSLQVLEKMSNQVAGFQQQNALNTYKIAQMGNSFKWALKDAGYGDDYIDKLTRWLVARLQ